VQIIAVIRSLLRVTRRPDKAGHVLLFDQNENVRPAFSLLILKAKFLSLNQTQNLSLYLTQQNDHQNYFLRRSRSPCISIVKILSYLINIFLTVSGKYNTIGCFSHKLLKTIYASPDLNLGLTCCKCGPDILRYNNGCRWLTEIKGDFADFAF
jgi:hypothetical protein